MRLARSRDAHEEEEEEEEASATSPPAATSIAAFFISGVWFVPAKVLDSRFLRLCVLLLPGGIRLV